MQGALSAVAKVMPMTYGVQAAGEAAAHTGVTGVFVRDALLILGCVILVLVASAATLKRRCGNSNGPKRGGRSWPWPG
jgi:ABC-2 type transport system permease protein